MALDCPNCPNQGWYAVPNIHTGEPEQVQCEFCETDENSKFYLAKKAISHPTPVQGEALPVVAEVCEQCGYTRCIQDTDGLFWPCPCVSQKTQPAIVKELADKYGSGLKGMRQLYFRDITATAEIARLQGELSFKNQKLLLVQHQYDIVHAFSKAAAMEIDSLRTQLSDTTGQVGKLLEALDNAEQAFVRIEMQLGHRLINGEMHEAPAGSMGELSEIATDALYDLRAALNSTAPK
jgi:predicted Zn-ribbon and HTH transcriptional regulator